MSEVFEIPSEIRARYCRVCENRLMTLAGVKCGCSEKPIFSNDSCSKYEEDDKEVERLLTVYEESEVEQSINGISKLIYVVPLIAIVLFWGYRFFQNQSLSSNYRITSAEIVEVDHSFNIPYFWVPELKIRYRYQIGNNEYVDAFKQSGDYNDYSSYLGKNYLLLFSPDDPSNNEIVLSTAVSSKILFPQNGVSQDSLKIYIKEYRRGD